MMEATKRLEMMVNDLYKLINGNQEKMLPLTSLVRCVQLQNEEGISEALKARFLILVLREFRKNRE